MNNQDPFSQYYENTEEDPFSQYYDEKGVEQPPGEIQNEVTDQIKKVQLPGIIKYPGMAGRALVTGLVGGTGELLNLARKAGSKSANKLIELSGGTPPEETPYRLPGIQDVENFIDHLTYNSLKPETPAEKIGTEAVKFVGGTRSFGGKLTPKSAGISAASGASGQAVREAGGSETQATAASFIPSILDLAKNVPKIIKNTPEFIGNLFAKRGKLRPDIIQEAQQAGIDIPITAANENKFLSWLNSRLSKSVFTKDIFEESMQKTTDGFRKNYENSLNRISPKPISKFEAGVKGQQRLEAAADRANRITSNLYQYALKKGKVIPPITPTKTLDKINEVKSKLIGKQPRYQSTLVEKGLERLDELENILKSNPKIPVDELHYNKINFSNDLYKNKELKPVEKLFEPVVQSMKEDLIEQNKNFPEFVNKYLQAEKYFKDKSLLYRSDLLKSIANGQRPEAILDAMSSVDGVRQVQKAIGFNKEGNDFVRMLRRKKLEEKISEKFIDSATNETKIPGKLFKDEVEREYIKELIGTDNYKNLNTLEKLGKQIKRTNTEFSNSSNTANVAGDAVGMVKMASALVDAVMSSTLYPLAKVIGGVKAARSISKLISSPEFFKAASNMTIQQQNNNPQGFVRNAINIANMMKKEMPQENIDEWEIEF